MFKTPTTKFVQIATRAASQRMMTTATAGPMVSQIETKWTTLPETEKQDVISKLDAVMKNDWTAVSKDDKRAIYYINYGSYGFREPISKKGDGMKILMGTSAIIGASLLTSFIIQKVAGSQPRTMTKEWQEESNKYAISQNSNPITGVSSEGYSGKGHVQSA
ncbi:hypothetical protein BB558_005625 [Smittium angustum]|uniref:Cytochrome c oxidase subunit IV n=1 Tax=Smittium angustum TaxID=133377 RepID=A0A2U1IVQ9_SMIAN|nr:hypothetical protein BB558_007193 [Smittium angustum]PVZ98361.1 hypothetical protein BB558_005625 [Smittium angustum]